MGKNIAHGNNQNQVSSFVDKKYILICDCRTINYWYILSHSFVIGYATVWQLSACMLPAPLSSSFAQPRKQPASSRVVHISKPIGPLIIAASADNS